MKRIIALLLALTMILTGCSQPQAQAPSTDVTDDHISDMLSVPAEWLEVQPEFDSLNDENLLLQVENLVYRETVQALNSQEYVVENVNAIYLSKEYLEEVEYNSQSNVYFGYTLAELDELFQGSRYIFTLGEDGNTMVQELQVIEDKTTETMLKNVAIGTGVILVCVTVSVVSAGVHRNELLCPQSSRSSFWSSPGMTNTSADIWMKSRYCLEQECESVNFAG